MFLINLWTHDTPVLAFFPIRLEDSRLTNGLSSFQSATIIAHEHCKDNPISHSWSGRRGLDMGTRVVNG
jgi:hypothetical protein